MSNDWFDAKFDLILDMEMMNMQLGYELANRKKIISRMKVGDTLAPLDYNISVKKVEALEREFNRIKEKYEEISK